MRLAFKRAKTYLRLGLVLVVVFVAAIVLWKNRSNNARVWFFWFQRDMNVVWLILWTVFATQAVEWVLRFSRGMWRDWHELRDIRRKEEAKALQEKREAEMAQRERRIEEMLKRGARPEAPDAPGDEAPAKDGGSGEAR